MGFPHESDNYNWVSLAYKEYRLVMGIVLAMECFSVAPLLVLGVRLAGRRIMRALVLIHQ